MRIPGFTAEASLFKSSEPYTMVGALEAPAGGAAVVPQACVNLGPCRICVTGRLFPPGVCVSFSCLGFNFRRCVP